jgi:supervillin
LRGELSEESHLIQISSLASQSLRRKTSFLFVNVDDGLFVIWHGCCSSPLQRSLIVECANKLSKRNSKSFNFAAKNLKTIELEEGSESEYLKNIFNSSDCDYSHYHSLLHTKTIVKESYEHTPRLFLLTSLYGHFESKEVFNPLRCDDGTLTCPYPFFQFQLYEEKQPAIFMFDNNSEIYVWQGWFDSYLSDASKTVLTESDATEGSTKIRFTMNRKCALQTAINYWKAKHENVPFKGFVVYAGLEPSEFTSLFPIWNVDQNARNCNLNDNKVLNQRDDIEDLLAQLNRDCYPLSVIRSRPLPDGVNPLTLEMYLNDEEFEQILHTSKEDFFNLPIWKQNNLKKKANLF